MLENQEGEQVSGYDQAKNSVRKLTSREWEELRSEMDLHFATQNTISTELLKEYEAPLQEAIAHINIIIGVIIGVALAGTKNVAKHQIETLARVFMAGLSDIKLRMDDAQVHNVPFHLVTPATYAPSLHQALSDVYSGKDKNGARLRNLLAENDELWHVLTQQRKFGPGQKGGVKDWRQQLAERWLELEIAYPDKNAAGIRQVLLEEIATLKGSFPNSKWLIKPDSSVIQKRWFDSLTKPLAETHPANYRNKLLTALATVP